MWYKCHLGWAFYQLAYQLVPLFSFGTVQKRDFFFVTGGRGGGMEAGNGITCQINFVWCPLRLTADSWCNENSHWSEETSVVSLSLQTCQASLILREAPWKLYDVCVNRCTNFNASLIFGLATPIELHTFDRNLPDSQTNPPWKFIKMVGISVTC